MIGDGWRRGQSAFVVMLREWRRVLRFGLVPALLLAVAQAFLPLDAEGGLNWQRWPLVLALMAISLWLSAVPQIRWNRWVILLDDAPVWWSIPLDARPLRFIGWSFLLALVGLLVAIAVGLALVLVFLVVRLGGLPEGVMAVAPLPAVLVLLYVVLKLSPVLVGVSIDQPTRLERVSRAMGWRRVVPLALAVLLFAFLPAVLLTAIASGLGGLLDPMAQGAPVSRLVTGLADMTINLFLTAFGCILIAGYYRDYVAPVLDGRPGSGIGTRLAD